MEHSANIYHPSTSLMWCNTNSLMSATSINNSDGNGWYWWQIKMPHMIWYDAPIEEEIIDGATCYKISGNIWICEVAVEESEYPELPEDEIMSLNKAVPDQATPELTGFHNKTRANTLINPSITVTSVKMENHPEHVSVMFGQVLNNLK